MLKFSRRQPQHRAPNRSLAADEHQMKRESTRRRGDSIGEEHVRRATHEACSCCLISSCFAHYWIELSSRGLGMLLLPDQSAPHAAPNQPLLLLLLPPKLASCRRQAHAVAESVLAVVLATPAGLPHDPTTVGFPGRKYSSSSSLPPSAPSSSSALRLQLLPQSTPSTSDRGLVEKK